MADKTTTTEIRVTPPNMQAYKFKLVGTAPLMQARFSAKAMQAMSDKMTGATKPGSRNRSARDFDDDYEQAFHKSTEGWYGVPCAAIRNSCISACRVAGIVMTRAKLSIFALGEGEDEIDGLPLVRIYGTPEQTRMATRNATGVADIRVRPMWRKWHILVTVVFDGDQFGVEDIINLLARAGAQVGIGEGRPDSKSSAGLGFGTFKVEAE